MKLKKIKVSGFKSFVDATTLNVSEQIIGVVGPNGCGKSNVIDAIRWVMGESSAKMLRGDSMTDVIFNGSSQRKPVGKASVELIFANTEGKVPEPYSQFRELSVQRVLSRDGKSEYLINGAKSRRKDIVDIFLGTGLGPRSYSVIEQGMVSRVVEAKPEDLRLFVEEAAGVSRYRERRRETETRIRHTRENLVHLEQRLDEINKLINRLQRQSQDAKRFSELRDEQRALQLKANAINWRAQNQKLERFDLDLNQIGVGLDGEVTKLRDIEKRIETARKEQAQSQEHFNDCQRLYYETVNLVSTLEERIKASEEGMKRLDRDLQNAHERLNITKEELAEVTEDLSSAKIQLEDLEPSIEEMDVMVTELEEEREEIIKARSDWQVEWDEFLELRGDTDRRLQIQKTKQQNTERQLQLLEERKARFQREYDELTEEVPHEIDDALVEEIEVLTTALDDGQQSLESLETSLSDTEEKWGSAREELAKMREQRSALVARRDSVSQILEKQSINHNEELDKVIRDNDIDVLGHVVDHVHIKSGFEQQADELLSQLLNAPIINASEENIAKLSALSSLSGEWLLLESKDSENALINAREFDIDSLLGECRPIDDLVDALKKRQTLSDNAYFITKEGHRVGRAYIKLAGQSGHSGVFASQVELDGFIAEIKRHDGQITELESQVEALAAKRSQLDNQLREERQSNREARDRLTHYQQQSMLHEERWQQVVKRKNQLQHELVDIDANLERLAEELTQSELLASEALTALDSLQERDALLRDQRMLHSNKVDAAEKALREKRLIAEQQRLQRERLLSVVAGYEQQIERLTSTETDLAERIETWASERSEYSGTDPMVESKLTKALEERREQEELVRVAQEQLEKSQQSIEVYERERFQQEQSVTLAREALENSRINRQEILVELNNLRKVASEHLPDNVKLEEWMDQMKSELINGDEILSSLHDVNKRIERIGTVNLLAIEEYDQELERQQYLDAQRADLIEALDTLESVIKKIDDDTRRLFNDTFNKLNDGFRTFFPRLFGGGSATLALTDSDELTAGVTLMAHPPGKRNSTIHLLSGGEKALTAVSLMFALFELNPAPFCLLDEVDAPLDDANVQRYCETLKTIAEKTQLIFITHNKITMAIANTLMGVTMAEPGVSRLVSVSIDEAIKLAE